MDMEEAQRGHDIIVIGTSAGGVETLRTLVQMLPADLPAALFVVMHIPAEAASMLPAILSRAGPLPARHPVDRAPFAPGQIYVAPPDHHLLVERGFVRVVRGPKENRCRPAIDPLFRTAARTYGPRVIGVVLTGVLDDGTAGLRAVKQRGGLAVVQHPADALYPGMPSSAIANVTPDYVLPLARIGDLLIELARTPAPPEDQFPVPAVLEREAQIAEQEAVLMQDEEIPGTPAVFACPECHGTLWELHDGDLIRFRCRVGHAFSIESMVAEHNESLETALWVALRALEESIALGERLVERARRHQHPHMGRRYAERIAEQEHSATLIREMLRQLGGAESMEDSA